jgi:hypothetical protein
MIQIFSLWLLKQYLPWLKSQMFSVAFLTHNVHSVTTRANHVTEVSRKTPIDNPRWFNRTNSIVPIRTPVKDKPPMNKYKEIQVVKQKKILPLRDISFNKLNSNPSRGDVQHSFISGPDAEIEFLVYRPLSFCLV